MRYLPLILIFLVSFCTSTMVSLSMFSNPALADTGKQFSEVPETTLPVGLQRAKVIYHRPKGVYLTTLTGKKNILLAPGGRYARWSPDGKSFVFLRGHDVMLHHLESGKETFLAKARKSRAVCFAENGKAVLFTDGKLLKRVEIDSLKTSTVLKKGRYLEIDMSHDGKLIGATMKSLTGYKVVLFSYPDLKSRTVGRGCSTSLSPDGAFVTVNDLDHKGLHLFNTRTLKKKRVPAPKDTKFDGQFWSNHPDWLVSSSEGKFSDIFIHHTKKGGAHRVTFTGDCNRADLFIPLE